MKLKNGKPQVARELFVIGTASRVIALLPLCVFSYGFAGMSGQQEAEKWEEIAEIRLKAAKAHELQAESKREQAFTARGTSSSFTVGDVLDGAGDEKFLASEEYQKASKQWEKAAKAYRTMDESDKAKIAAENAGVAWEAAKRTLREGAEFYKMAEAQFDNVRDLDKQVKTLKKLARNIEKLMEMK